MNISGNYTALENYFFDRVFSGSVANLSKILILWQEVFENGIELDKSAVIQIWKKNYLGLLKEVCRRFFVVRIGRVGITRFCRLPPLVTPRCYLRAGIWIISVIPGPRCTNANPSTSQGLTRRRNWFWVARPACGGR